MKASSDRLRVAAITAVVEEIRRTQGSHQATPTAGRPPGGWKQAGRLERLGFDIINLPPKGQGI